MGIEIGRIGFQRQDFVGDEFAHAQAQGFELRGKGEVHLCLLER